MRLLRDNDPDTVSLLKNQLVDNGPDIIGHLRDLAAVDDATVSGHAHDILAEIESRAALDEFTLLCHLFADDGDIEEALLAAGARFPAGHRDRALPAQARIWGRQLTRLTDSAISTRERVAILTNYLANDLGFRGNSEQYYDVHNSLLPSLIDSKLGIPISLARACTSRSRAGGHQGRGDQPAGPFHRAARGHFLRPVPPGENPHALGLRVDPAQAEADFPAVVPGAGDLAHDPRSACWRICSTFSRTTATKRSTSASPPGSRRWNASRTVPRFAV